MNENNNQQPSVGAQLDLFAAEPQLLTPAELAARAMDAEAEDASEQETEKAAPEAGAAVGVSAPTDAGQNEGSAADVSGETAHVEKRKKKKKKKKDGRHGEGGSRQKTVLEQLHDFINEDEDQPIRINFRGLIGGNGLPGMFRRNWLFITILVFFTCVYITCRYMMQSAVIENDKLSEILIDRRYKMLTLDSELLERTLSSQIERHLKDSTIHTPTEQAFPLHTQE